MIIFDTETTGLPLPGIVALDQQPKIIEFAAIKLDDFDLAEMERIEFLCNPQQPLEQIITDITHITDDMLKDEPTFAARFLDLASFFLGETTLVAHNLDFDKSLLRFELMRIGKECAFPWPVRQICTVEASFNLNNKRMHLSDLHEHCCGERFKDAHRAMADTEALVRCVRWLKNNNMM
jgi:DNA polymerase III epsilon subunit-like protein